MTDLSSHYRLKEHLDFTTVRPSEETPEYVQLRWLEGTHTPSTIAHAREGLYEEQAQRQPTTAELVGL